MARYTTILFDADNTLLDFLRSEREGLADALGDLGVHPNEEMIETYSRINIETWKKLERGEIDKKTLRTLRFSDFCAYYGLSLDVERLAMLYTERLATKSYLMEGALDVCRALHGTCRLYVITNGMKSVQQGRFDPSPLAPLFEAAFISEELGAEKPAKLFFDKVASAIPDFDPAKTLVVGDSLTSDIAGGIAAGLDTCWFNQSGAPVPSDMPITYVIRGLDELLPLVLG